MPKESVAAAYGEGPLYIRRTGVWNMQELYESIAEFFHLRKYKFHERVYKHKRPSPFGVERQYIWEAERKETEYVQFHYAIYMHTYDARDIEVVDQQGDKRIFTKGRIWVELQADLATDWEKQFGGTSFLRELKNFFEKYVIKNNIVMGWETKLKYELYELHALIKNKLQMESDEFEHRHIGGIWRRY
ncbi:hypothetical protein HYU13_03285 [Candidatus Woesearchaeota archaeon]|nr:hypothetical protein [Candidatus Woesearchaeota archaeon]